MNNIEVYVIFHAPIIHKRGLKKGNIMSNANLADLNIAPLPKNNPITNTIPLGVIVIGR